MPLMIKLEYEEWILIGGTKIVNIAPDRAKFWIDGSSPVLRQDYALSAATADTTAKRVYLAIQRLYMRQIADLSEYAPAIALFLEEHPEEAGFVQECDQLIAATDLYGALRRYRKFV